MTTTGTRVKGHARQYESLDSTGGTSRVQRGGTVSCSCRQWSCAAISAEDGALLHAQHKANVLSGVHARRHNAEILRRVEVYEDLLRRPEEMKRLTLTEEQVRGWLSEIWARA